MELDQALDWVAARTNAVLITLRRDGRAQSSDVSYAVEGSESGEGDDRQLLISVTDDRAKTANMRRDNRVVVHVTSPSTWSYISMDGTVELMPVASSPNDDTVEALVRYYEAVAGGPHPDWDEYRRAMVDDKRLIVRFHPTSAVGQINS